MLRNRRESLQNRSELSFKVNDFNGLVESYNRVDLSKIKDNDERNRKRKHQQILDYDRGDPYTLLINSYGVTAEFFGIDKYELTLNIDIEYYCIVLKENHKTVMNTSIIDLIEFAAARAALKFCNNME